MSDVEKVPNVFQAFSGAMNEISHVSKGQRNDHFKFNFRGVDAVMNAAGPAFRKHGIVPVPRVIQTHSSPMGKQKLIEGTVEYTFYGPAGDSFTCLVAAEASDMSDKGMAKFMSVAYRIALLQVLCLPTDDPDPDQSGFERSEVKPQPMRDFVSEVSLVQTSAEARALWAAAKSAGAPEDVIAVIAARGKVLKDAETSPAPFEGEDDE